MFDCVQTNFRLGWDNLFQFCVVLTVVYEECSLYHKRNIELVV
jgi:hypothetical protein